MCGIFKKLTIVLFWERARKKIGICWRKR